MVERKGRNLNGLFLSKVVTSSVLVIVGSRSVCEPLKRTTVISRKAKAMKGHKIKNNSENGQVSREELNWWRQSEVWA